MWLLTVSLAMGCSCGGFGRPTVERCATATRVFSGTIVSYDWPLAYQSAAWAPVAVHLEVDRVWAGDVPARLTTYTGLGGGDCGIAQAPGTRLVVCDDDEGQAEVPFNRCVQPAFGPDAEEILLSAFPDGYAPRPLGGWEANEPGIQFTWKRNRLLLLPVGGVLLGALVGRLSRRWGSPRRPTAWAPLALAAGFVLVGVLSHGVLMQLGSTRTWTERWVIGLSLGGVLLGGVLGGRVGRLGGSILGAVVVSTLAMRLAFGRLHLPIQRPDAAACSLDRARTFLAALPPGRADEVLRAHEDDLPRSCTDLGLGTIRLDYVAYAHCLLFGDGSGGSYAVCPQTDDDGMLDPTREPDILYGFTGY